MTTTEKGVLVPLWAMSDCDGDPRNAMLLAQITWWFQPAQRDGSPRTNHLVERSGKTWMFTTDAELAEQTGMSTDQVYRGRRALVKRGLIEAHAGLVKGQKVTLVRPALEPDAEVGDSADPRNPETADPRNYETADSRDDHSADPRDPLLRKRVGRMRENARAEVSDERVDWQVPDVVARAGCLEAASELCAHWAERLEARGVNVGARARSKAWVAPMEAMLRIDQREPAHVRRVIDWLEDGRDDVASFWRANVLSPDKLRTRWDQMGQQYQRERSRPGRDPQGLSSLVAEIQRREAAGE